MPTHGGSATVDDATAAWLNTYYRVLVGVDRGMGMDDDGSFTLSGTRGFTTAP